MIDPGPLGICSLLAGALLEHAGTGFRRVRALAVPRHVVHGVAQHDPNEDPVERVDVVADVVDDGVGRGEEFVGHEQESSLSRLSA